ncbi:hypothetical protein SKAU_G00056000 [Synaphobranchus kaupii]|uniref:Uncharacterized protein n=1 Tax=Synaphobranchus kaupii TaxID=118154 RepID=A0A9Q1G5C5_SYNKA|nr:hypothetical protein SKAU_G00056000 [Synaphobranchus kaupii]
MENSNAPPSARGAGLGDVAVVGGGGLVEASVDVAAAAEDASITGSGSSSGSEAVVVVQCMKGLVAYLKVCSDRAFIGDFIKHRIRGDWCASLTEQDTSRLPI